MAISNRIRSGAALPGLSPRARKVLAPAVVLVAFLSLWQAGFWNELFGLGEYTLPKPLDIAETGRDEAGTLFGHSLDSYGPTLVGYVLGNSLGFAIALLLLVLPGPVSRWVSGVAGAVQALPIIAVAPLVALYVEGLAFKATVVMIMAFPSTMVFVSRGLTSVDPDALDLMDSYGASARQVFWRIRLPGSLPFVFTALKYTTVLALVGVIVCEVLRAHTGLGYEMTDALQSFRAPEAWAAVAILAVVGIAWYSLLGLLERRFFPWSVEREPRP